MSDVYSATVTIDKDKFKDFFGKEVSDYEFALFCKDALGMALVNKQILIKSGSEWDFSLLK